ncbi:MAG: hypothetical protein JWM44_1251 [Bacilli bacterium]|jgi:hypothetical protein|nr:hypothetical protein [Bacilli bacterium]
MGIRIICALFNGLFKFNRGQKLMGKQQLVSADIAYKQRIGIHLCLPS